MERRLVLVPLLAVGLVAELVAVLLSILTAPASLVAAWCAASALRRLARHRPDVRLWAGAALLASSISSLAIVSASWLGLVVAMAGTGSLALAWLGAGTREAGRRRHWGLHALLGLRRDRELHRRREGEDRLGPSVDVAGDVDGGPRGPWVAWPDDPARSTPDQH